MNRQEAIQSINKSLTRFNGANIGSAMARKTIATQILDDLNHPDFCIHRNIEIFVEDDRKGDGSHAVSDGVCSDCGIDFNREELHDHIM